MMLFAPLAIVSPIGPRNFYAGTMALTLLVLILLKQVGVLQWKYTGVIAPVLAGCYCGAGMRSGSTYKYIGNGTALSTKQCKKKKNDHYSGISVSGLHSWESKEKLDQLFMYEEIGDITFLLEGEEE